MLEMVSSVFFTVRGVLTSLQNGALRPLMGYVLFGVVAAYSLMIVARILLSWGMSHGNRTMRFLVRVTEPVLDPFRRLIPPLGMFDVSPMVVLLILHVLQRIIVTSLID
jgi:YggT family protein